MAATLDDVRAIALALPGASESISGHTGGATWRARNGSFVWERGPSRTDLAQLAERGLGWPDGVVIAVRTDGIDEREALVQTFPDAFFTIPHFDGYPAVLVRLDAVAPDHLREMITAAWMLRTPKRVVAEWLAAHPGA
jgi:hypothetical protein